MTMESFICGTVSVQTAQFVAYKENLKGFVVKW